MFNNIVALYTIDGELDFKEFINLPLVTRTQIILSKLNKDGGNIIDKLTNILESHKRDLNEYTTYLANLNQNISPLFQDSTSRERYITFSLYLPKYLTSDVKNEIANALYIDNPATKEYILKSPPETLIIDLTQHAMIKQGDISSFIKFLVSHNNNEVFNNLIKLCNDYMASENK